MATTVGVPKHLITMIPNGVPSFDEATVSTGLRKELGVSADAKLVGFVGRLAPQKCLQDLIWAFQLLHQVVDNVSLVIVGQGPERDRLAELADSFGCRHLIHFLGHREDARALTRQLDAFCLPSSFEGMSNSLMDAMSAGVPVVVSDIAANTELVSHEINGLTFPLANGPGITRALKRVLTDHEFARQLGSAARQTMEADYSVQKLVDRHVELYSKLTAS